MSESMQVAVMVAAKTVHMIGILVWLGGVVFAILVFSPAAGKHLESVPMGKVMNAVASRFRPLVYGSLGLIWGSGVVMNAIEGAPKQGSEEATLWLSMMGVKHVLAFFLTISVFYSFERLVPGLRRAVEEESTDMILVLRQRQIGMGYVVLTVLAIILVASAILASLPIAR